MYDQSIIHTGIYSQFKLNSTIFFRRISASLKTSFGKFHSQNGTATTFIFAAFPPETPEGESSKTIQFSGSISILFAAVRNISGAGLPFLTSGSSPQTTTSNNSKRS